jgi:hypothetical protein
MTYPVTVLPEPNDLKKRLKKESWRMYYVKSECYIGNVESVQMIDNLKQEVLWEDKHSTGGDVQTKRND